MTCSRMFGGRGKIFAVQTDDETTDYQMVVSFRGKEFKDIDGLSYVEKKLAWMAFIFSLDSFKDKRIYVMDDVDSGIDEKYINIYAEYLRELSENRQMIIIAQRNELLSISDRVFRVEIDAKGISTATRIR